LPAAKASALAELATEHGLTPAQLGRLRRYAEEVGRDPLAPTAAKTPLEAEQHLVDCLAALAVKAVAGAAQIADVGSGAGFPGLALAIALPTARVTLVEANGGKALFLQRLIVRLGVDNAAVAHCRVETWEEGFERHDLVVARAVGPRPVVLEYAAPLVAVGGLFVDWRTAADPTQLERAGLVAAAVGLEPAGTIPYGCGGRLQLELYRKTGPTPPGFPRRPGVARKRPLG